MTSAITMTVIVCNSRLMRDALQLFKNLPALGWNYNAIHPELIRLWNMGDRALSLSLFYIELFSAKSVVNTMKSWSTKTENINFIFFYFLFICIIHFKKLFSERYVVMLSFGPYDKWM